MTANKTRILFLSVLVIFSFAGGLVYFLTSYVTPYFHAPDVIFHRSVQEFESASLEDYRRYQAKQNQERKKAGIDTWPILKSVDDAPIDSESCPPRTTLPSSGFDSDGLLNSVITNAVVWPVDGSLTEDTRTEHLTAKKLVDTLLAASLNFCESGDAAKATLFWQVARSVIQEIEEVPDILYCATAVRLEDTAFRIAVYEKSRKCVPSPDETDRGYFHADLREQLISGIKMWAVRHAMLFDTMKSNVVDMPVDADAGSFERSLGSRLKGRWERMMDKEKYLNYYLTMERIQEIILGTAGKTESLKKRIHNLGTRSFFLEDLDLPEGRISRAISESVKRRTAFIKFVKETANNGMVGSRLTEIEYDSQSRIVGKETYACIQTDRMLPAE